MGEELTNEIQNLIEDKLKQDYTKFRTQGIMIGWLSAFQVMDKRIKTMRYKKDIVAYLEVEIKRIKEIVNAPPEPNDNADS